MSMMMKAKIESMSRPRIGMFETRPQHHCMTRQQTRRQVYPHQHALLCLNSNLFSAFHVLLPEV